MREIHNDPIFWYCSYREKNTTVKTLTRFAVKHWLPCWSSHCSRPSKCGPTSLDFAVLMQIKSWASNWRWNAGGWTGKHWSLSTLSTHSPDLCMQQGTTRLQSRPPLWDCAEIYCWHHWQKGQCYQPIAIYPIIQRRKMMEEVGRDGRRMEWGRKGQNGAVEGGEWWGRANWIPGQGHYWQWCWYLRVYMCMGCWHMSQYQYNVEFQCKPDAEYSVMNLKELLMAYNIQPRNVNNRLEARLTKLLVFIDMGSYVRENKDIYERKEHTER